MPRIGSTISGLENFFLAHLSRVDSAIAESAIRISTGRQVNRPSDDPSAFLQIRQFEQRLSVVEDAKNQVEVAASIGAESQLALDGIRSELDTIRSALELDVDQSLSSEERATQQAVIDAAIESIGDLSKTEINGRRYLDGSVNYRFAGKDSSEIRTIQVFSAAETTFSGTVSAAATQAEVTYTGAGGAVTADATFTLTGERGSSTVSVTNGMSLTAASDLINQVSHETGITAAVAGDDLTITSVDYGSDATTTVSVSSGSFATAGTGQGTDATVTINGKAIDAGDIDGNRVQYTSTRTNVAIEFQAGFTGAFSSITVLDDDIAKFRLTPDVSDVSPLAVSGAVPQLLGGLSGQLSDLASGSSLAGLSGNTSQALRVVDEALSSLSSIDGVVDAFAEVTVESSGSLLTSLGSQLETTISELNSVDESKESLLLSNNQSLGANTISAISILQQQQASMVALIRSIAGI